jgi:predicted nucleic acid-binding protein
VALLLESHQTHAEAAAWARGKQIHLTGHSCAETYSVLTRLHGDARLAAVDAATLLDRRFAAVAVLPENVTRSLASILARAGIAGGAVYDALVALAAKENGLVLGTLDWRARSTYEALGVSMVFPATPTG